MLRAPFKLSERASRAIVRWERQRAAVLDAPGARHGAVHHARASLGRRASFPNGSPAPQKRVQRPTISGQQ
jgi:hypothetical protein